MTTIYQIKIDDTDAGISSNYGIAVERAYYSALDLGLISEAKEVPHSILGTQFEGNQIDLMARALEEQTSHQGISFTKHDLDIEPTTNSDMGPAPYGRMGCISWALQQAIYDVASGSDPKAARDALISSTSTLVVSVGESVAEQQIFFWDQREAGGYICKNFRDFLFPVPLFNMRDSVKQSIEMLPYLAADVFDRAIIDIENSVSIDPNPKR